MSSLRNSGQDESASDRKTVDARRLTGETLRTTKSDAMTTVRLVTRIIVRWVEVGGE